MTTPVRRRSLSATLSAAATLAVIVGLLAPVGAPARQSQSRRGHAANGSGIAHPKCNLKRRNASPNRGRKPAPACSSARPVRAAHGLTVPPVSSAGLEATPVGPAGVPSTTQVAATTPASQAAPSSGAAPSESSTVTDPIDPRFLTEVPFGRTSFWVQPWRSYLDTWPASRLLEAVGINFNITPTQAEYTAQVLQESGFKLARISIPWSTFTYEDPSVLRPPSATAIRAKLTALHNHGLRPLIVLNANSGGPAPFKDAPLETVAPAAAGATTVTLSAASAAEVVPGKTGFNDLSFGGTPDILIKSVAAGNVATLSRPLRNPLPAGRHQGVTLRFAPFTPPLLPNGKPNPAFAESLSGWLTYVGAVCKYASEVVGPDGYDLEVWNELTFGSQFLNAENYYGIGSDKELSEPAPESGGPVPTEREQKTKNTHAVIKALLAATVGYVRNPANGISSKVGITDGFASETPFPSGAAAPLGMTALSKHPYEGVRSYPSEYITYSDRPMNALGVQDTLPGQHGLFTPLFIPNYETLFPEYWLTALSTETLIRDIAPTTTEVYDFPHGREVGPPGGVPVQKWITEYNAGIPKAFVTTLSPADKEHFHAKTLLRSLVSMVSKGISREYFFAAAPGGLSLVGRGFWSALESNPGSYPGPGLAGEILTGFKNMLARFQGPGPSGAARQLKLLSITQQGNHAEFTGDGTAAHPSLYDREVLAVFPFQSSPTHFVIPVYVMTSNLLTQYEPGSGIGRFDLPDETFKITLGNLPETSLPPLVSAYDPLHDQSTPARLISRQGSTAEFEIAATDYPRLLSVDYTGR